MNKPTIQNAYAQMEKDAKKFADSLKEASDFTKNIIENAYLAGEIFIARKLLNAASKEPSVKAIDWEQRRYEIAKELFLTMCFEAFDSVEKAIEVVLQSTDAFIEELKKTSK